MPRVARATVAERSSATRIHRLMPSSPLTSTSWAASTSRHERPPPRVHRSGPRHDLRRRRVLQQLEQQRLEDPARPAGTEQSAVGDGGDDVAGAADRRQPQVGPVALREAADVHRPCRAAHRPRLSSGADEMSLAWSSSMTIVSRSRRARRPAPPPGVRVSAEPAGFWARGWRNTARAPAAKAAPRPSGVRPSSSTSTPTTSQPSWSRRSSSGGKPGCSTTTRSPMRSTTWATRSRASIAPSTTVIASGGNGHEATSSLLQRREHRVVEVARRQRLLADPRHDRPEVGQQRRVRRAGREVELEVPRTLGDPPVAAWPARARRFAHVGAVAPAGLDGTDVGEAAPRLADRGRRDPEPARQLADGRQPGAHRKRAGRDHPADAPRRCAGRREPRHPTCRRRRPQRRCRRAPGLPDA